MALYTIRKETDTRVIRIRRVIISRLMTAYTIWSRIGIIACRMTQGAILNIMSQR